LCYDGLELSENTERQVLDNFHDFLRKNRLADIIIPPPHFSVFKSIPTNCDYYQIGLICYDIASKKGRFLENMKSNYRNEIRKLETEKDLTLEIGEDQIYDAFNIIKKTHDIQNLSFANKKVFESIKDNLSINSYIACYKYKSKPIGAVIILYDKSKAYYLYSGNEKIAEFPGVNKILIYEAIKFLEVKGVSHLIMGGYRDEQKASKKIIGIQQFKLRFGSTVEYGYHFIKVINPLRYKLFKVLLKVKSILTGKKLELLNLEGLDIKQSK
jgi:lipid II:glycine glycyltransferase (peptidoglycan interpeptide bridge formation enzyme)